MITKRQVLAEASTISCDPTASVGIVAAVQAADMDQIRQLARDAYADGLRGGIAHEVAVHLAWDAGVEW